MLFKEDIHKEVQCVMSSEEADQEWLEKHCRKALPIDPKNTAEHNKFRSRKVSRSIALDFPSIVFLSC